MLLALVVLVAEVEVLSFVLVFVAEVSVDFPVVSGTEKMLLRSRCSSARAWWAATKGIRRSVARSATRRRLEMTDLTIGPEMRVRGKQLGEKRAAQAS